MKLCTPLKSYRKPSYKLVVLRTLVAFLWLVRKEFNCLRISSIEVPAAVWNGSQVTLSCNHELARDEQLYSVKWYKNYVEFYRFQPQQAGQEQPASASPQEPAATQVGQNLNLNRADEVAGTRREFELHGINLDLSKSNATQVHLRQVNLSSEATFKCEVSADSPSFATVSAERQLKVYVLPKQRLELIDNWAGHSANNWQQGNTFTTTTVGTTLKPAQNNEQQPVARLRNNAKQLIYQLDELVNFTCVAGPSRPAARLSWFLNDEPIVAANSSRGSSGSGLEASEISHELRQMPNKLTESRSTLVLRLQTSQLKVLRKQTTATSSQRNQAAYSSAIVPLKLSCRSLLSVEFSSETSVQVSNGKAANLKSNSRRQEFMGSLPLASLWTNDMFAHKPTGHEHENKLQHLEDGSDSGQFRRPAREQRLSSSSSAVDALTEAWIGPSEDRAGGSGWQEGKRQPRPRHNLVWTQRQLRAQADRIEQLVARSQPNQLEAPHIEAQLIRRERPELAANEPGAEREPASEPDDEERTTPSPPSIVISSNQFGVPDEVPPSGGDQFKSRQLNHRDYELDELVNFTCHPTIFTGRQPDDAPVSVQVKWFINNQEIVANQVNNFDGERFHYSQPVASNEQSRLIAEGRATNWLLMEFTASLMQLKELSLKCRTLVEQPLVVDESAQVVSLSTSPFIQANTEQLPGQRAPLRPSMFTVRDPQQRQQFGAARYQSSSAAAAGADQAPPAGSQQRNRANVIRMRQPQQARSHSANNRLNLVVVWFCLAVALLTPRLIHQQRVR